MNRDLQKYDQYLPSCLLYTSALANVDNNEEALSTDIRSSSFIVLRCINFGISHYFIDISQGDKGKFDKY